MASVDVEDPTVTHFGQEKRPRWLLPGCQGAASGVGPRRAREGANTPKHEMLPDTLRLPTRVLGSAGTGVRHRERVEKELCGPTGQPRFLMEKSHLSIFGQPSTFLGRDEVFPAQY